MERQNTFNTSNKNVSGHNNNNNNIQPNSGSSFNQQLGINTVPSRSNTENYSYSSELNSINTSNINSGTFIRHSNFNSRDREANFLNAYNNNTNNFNSEIYTSNVPTNTNGVPTIIQSPNRSQLINTPYNNPRPSHISNSNNQPYISNAQSILDESVSPVIVETSINVPNNITSNINLTLSNSNTTNIPVGNIIDNSNNNYVLNQNSVNTQKSNNSESGKYTNGVDFEKICGYNPFMKEIFSRVTCSICTLIPFEPLECKNCNAVVCKPCIEKWKRKECILKCGGENYDLPSRILRDIINSIVIKCKNANKGCGTQLRIDYMRTHESECDFDEIKCPFTDCQIVDIRKNINIHIDKCEFNKIKCKFCKNFYKKSDFNAHIELDCQEVLIECDKCQKSDKRKDFPKHNCILALKEENKDLQNTISNLMSSLDSMKFQHEDIVKQLEDERRAYNEKKTLMNLMINLLKSNYELDDIKSKSYNTCNPIQIPYIFRFMTSSRTLQITNLADYTFTKISLQINFEIPTSHQSIVTSSKRIFIVGGVNHEKKTYEFDVLNKTLIEHAEMNIGRRRHILTELRPGVFIATGGSNQNEEVLRDCEAYIVSKDIWIKIASLNVPRFYHTAFSYKGAYMYVIGGCHTSNSSLVNLNTIERIDLSYELNGSWEILSVKELSLLKPRSRLSYLFISSEKILLFGGIPDYQAVFYDISRQEISLAENQFNIEGRFFFNDRCTWQNETLFISSQSSRCIFNHNLNCWELKEFSEENNN